MEIVFLGTGGGRYNLVSQERLTGGFRINGPLRFHVDPGPGALAASRRFGQEAEKTDVLVVTHNHIDHANDAGVLCEAMCVRSRGRKGWLVGSESVIEGDENGDRGVSVYHQGKMRRVVVAKPGVGIRISIAGKGALLSPTRVKHEDGTGFGFVLEMGGRRLGYTSDTEYFPGISPHYANCDVLIVNNLKPKKDGIPGHLDTGSAARLVCECRPRLAIISHMGLRLVRASPSGEAAKIEKASGIRTIAAEDGMKIRLDTDGCLWPEVLGAGSSQF